MNLKDEVITWPKHYKSIPKPFYVVRCDDHFMVCTLDKDFNLIDEVNVIHWNGYVVRRWALEFAGIDIYKPVHWDKTEEYGESLCGLATSGNPSFRWADKDSAVTCKKCKRKMGVK